MTDRARELLERCRVYFYHTGLMQNLGEEIRVYLAEPEVKPQPFNQTEFDEMVRKGTEAWKDYKPEQDEEPACVVHNTDTPGHYAIITPAVPAGTKLYLHPAPRPDFVRLSEEEIRTWNIVGYESLLEFVRSIEDALEEKNK